MLNTNFIGKQIVPVQLIHKVMEVFGRWAKIKSVEINIRVTVLSLSFALAIKKYPRGFNVRFNKFWIPFKSIFRIGS